MKIFHNNHINRAVYLIFFIYLITLHVVLISIIFKPSFAYKIAIKLKLEPQNELVTHFMASMNAMHNRVDKNTPPQAVIFIGDSLIQGLSVSSIHPVAVNFGIGHDTVSGVTKRSSKYNSLKKASVILISVGINDLRYNSVSVVIARYKAMLQELNWVPNIFIHEVLPIDSRILGAALQGKVIAFNEGLFKLAKEFDDVKILKSSSKFINLNNDLKSSLHVGDGLHLNKNGYALWIQQLKQQLDAQ